MQKSTSKFGSRRSICGNAALLSVAVSALVKKTKKAHQRIEKINLEMSFRISCFVHYVVQQRSRGGHMVEIRLHNE